MDQQGTSKLPPPVPTTTNDVASSSRGDQQPSSLHGGARVVPTTKKSAWSKAEDALLREQVRLHGAEKWLTISAAIPGRNAKSCRLRWMQHLLPGLDTGKPFTPEEDARIVHCQRLFPNKWATIAGFLPGRTDNAIKNRWNSVLGKRQRQQDHGHGGGPGDGRTLKLFPLRPGDVRMRRGDDDGTVLRYAVSAQLGAEEEDRRAGACMELFPLRPGDIVRRNVSEAPPVDVDYGAGDALTALTLWPSSTTLLRL
ncbi:hypothetical protein PR202_gb00842 [Eleusine coracana subsp. coracana]|uniref:Uncharacterized protein n=1 Tax=Eleusine coracana subsp. coracana TaxID=191504 RepID=A0AAV5DV27_ELECO|nr:hypothetical protein PR202_gb00842 [Eleusine coracana subsp. coracana]